MLELTHVNPDWFRALSVALVRPIGEPERRHGQDPRQQRGHTPRSRRVTDDLAWLRVAFCDPEPHGLHPLSHGRAVAAWVPDDDAVKRLRRLRDRAILEAAGFRLLETEAPTPDKQRKIATSDIETRDRTGWLLASE
jgi:hypothetical protein